MSFKLEEVYLSYACGFALGIQVAIKIWIELGMECFDQQDLPNQLWNKILMLHNILQITVSTKSDGDLRIFVVQIRFKEEEKLPGYKVSVVNNIV